MTELVSSSKHAATPAVVIARELTPAELREITSPLANGAAAARRQPVTLDAVATDVEESLPAAATSVVVPALQDGLLSLNGAGTRQAVETK